MKSLADGYQLSNGVVIPCMGLGTWQSNGPTTIQAVKSALNMGYRLVDTAAAYGNEISVGQGIKESGIPREEIFVTSKLRNSCHGYDAAMEAFEKTIGKLGIDYLDLYLIHWPNPVQYRPIWKEATIGTWKAFEELYRAGKIRAIGVSNFMPHHIELLKENCDILPMVNQLKLCPGVTQPETVKYCQENEIIVEAYSPFGTGAIFQVPEMKALAEKYHKSVGQIVLRWCMQMKFVPLPKSANASRVKENSEIFDFELSTGDVEFISGLKGVCGEAPVPDEIDF
ncbi:MAG: aldo/keto reductase [Blautia sp.]|nr:aldo/keto reductase [Blautia sp.]